MEEPLIFVLRIYRNADGRMDGVVERVEKHTCHDFHSGEELWRAILHLSDLPRGPNHTISSKEDPP